MSENDGITVRQTVAHTIQLWPHGLDTSCGSHLCEEKDTTTRSLSKPRSRISGAPPYDTTTTGPRGDLYNTRTVVNKYTSYILHYITFVQTLLLISVKLYTLMRTEEISIIVTFVIMPYSLL